MILASIELEGILTLVGALFVGINWLRKLMGPSSEKPTSQDLDRSFKEALGLPPDQPAPPPVKPRPGLLVNDPLPRIDPRGLVVSSDPWAYGRKPRRRAGDPSQGSSQAATRSLPPPLKVPAPHNADFSKERHTAVEQIVLPELEVPEVREIATAASRVMAIPDEKTMRSRGDAYEIAPRESQLAGHALRDWFRDPSSLRSAILIQEVLGPPRSLQRSE
jgi:hypothetical protein